VPSAALGGHNHGPQLLSPLRPYPHCTVGAYPDGATRPDTRVVVSARLPAPKNRRRTARNQPVATRPNPVTRKKGRDSVPQLPYSPTPRSRGWHVMVTNGSSARHGCQEARGRHICRTKARVVDPDGVPRADIALDVWDCLLAMVCTSLVRMCCTMTLVGGGWYVYTRFFFWFPTVPLLPTTVPLQEQSVHLGGLWLRNPPVGAPPPYPRTRREAGGSHSGKTTRRLPPVDSVLA